jgi:hypothetical protein
MKSTKAIALVLVIILLLYVAILTACGKGDITNDKDPQDTPDKPADPTPEPQPEPQPIPPDQPTEPTEKTFDTSKFNKIYRTNVVTVFTLVNISGNFVFIDEKAHEYALVGQYLVVAIDGAMLSFYEEEGMLWCMVTQTEAELVEYVTLEEYVEPDEPVEPVEPPVEPTEPAEPIVPDEPTEPIIPDEPVEPTDPVEPIIPDEPIEPTEPVEPIIPDEPLEPPVEPIVPDDPVVPPPEEPIEPPPPEEPVVPDVPVVPDEPSDPYDEFPEYRIYDGTWVSADGQTLSIYFSGYTLYVLYNNAEVPAITSGGSLGFTVGNITYDVTVSGSLLLSWYAEGVDEYGNYDYIYTELEFY